MDLVENENFTKSVFYRDPNSYDGNYNKKDEKWNNWWYKRESWKTAKKLFKYKFDAWHLSKSTMIILIIASGIVYAVEEHTMYTKYELLNFFIDGLIRGISWNLIFPLFYHKLFRSKTWQK